ncbi:hypothetical protein M970_061600 [Encephalitozoon cuniculi EcunIII-L]|uniref:Uncharacterized protein n=1 Tax=Encephalitozoon cuniculi TaxID=6035 RepID=M1K8S1_ENCCN|nr:hypothetical protein ECU06_1600 [Encephalitozoon cuniculi]KMV66057.1 hypothetical protein M970_061600 [Encephalitozoon cuniculi EcunIII-L]UYI27757.1 hypothetical protein J0A71_07g16400 [Encephalitozoon cuniculi]
MEFLSACKNYTIAKWRYIEDIFFIGCMALQYNCDTNDHTTPIGIAMVAIFYLFTRTIYELFDGFKGDCDKSFTVFDFLKTLLVVIHIFIYLLTFIVIGEIIRHKQKWIYNIDGRSLIITQTLYMFLASLSIMSNISSNSVIEVVRGILGLYEITSLSDINDDKDYGKLMPLMYPMVFSFLPFVLGEVSSMISKWLFQNKLSEYTPRVAKTITVISAVICTVVGIYGVFVMLNVIKNISVIEEAKPDASKETSHIRKAAGRLVSDVFRTLGSLIISPRSVAGVLFS